MKEIRTKIYVFALPETHEIVYSGIEFSEFIKYSPRTIENVMLISGGSNIISLKTSFERGLELFNGHDLVNELIKVNIKSLGNFCFVDYDSHSKTSDLSEGQIAELLYLGHMFKPLNSPFFEPLHNNFAYLAHDDGWYCKLYCKNPLDFISVLCKKIIENLNIDNINEPGEDVKEEILKLATYGLMIDLEEVKNDSNTLNLYVVGEYADMDIVLNNFHKIKSDALQVKKLSF